MEVDDEAAGEGEEEGVKRRGGERKGSNPAAQMCGKQVWVADDPFKELLEEEETVKELEAVTG